MLKAKLITVLLLLTVLLISIFVVKQLNEESTQPAASIPTTAQSKEDIARLKSTIEMILGKSKYQSEFAPYEEIGQIKKFKPSPVSNGNKASYELFFQMDEQGYFKGTTVIDIQNLSKDRWDKLVFYMIPNAFTKENKHEQLPHAGEFKINEIKMNGEAASYELNYDTLIIPIQTLKPKKKVKVEVEYEFKPPMQGSRFSNVDGGYFLAQFYPMLATYQNGWNKADYIYGTVETYFTDFSDFKVHYQIPEGYTLLSAAGERSAEEKKSGSFDVKRAKEVNLAIVKDYLIHKTVVEGIEIRAAGSQTHEKFIKQALSDAANAITYFTQTLGPYPYSTLDIVLAEGAMEYPGFITVTSTNDSARLQTAVVHEVAHQWFYGMVSNDQYHAGFIDEGMTELSTMLFLLDHEKLPTSNVFLGVRNEIVRAELQPGSFASNLTVKDYNYDTYPYLYAMPAVKILELSAQYEGIATAKAFLNAYFNTYKYKHVDTKEFVRFTKAYFNLQDDMFFENWLKLSQ
jgi:Peptidase family M1 domain